MASTTYKIPWNKGKHPTYVQGSNNVFYKKGKIKQTCSFCHDIYEGLVYG